MAQLPQTGNPPATDAEADSHKESEPAQVIEIEDLIAASPASARFLDAELWRASTKNRRARALPRWTLRWVPHRFISDELAENVYRRRIIYTLRSMGTAAEPAIPALRASLYDSDDVVGAIAADALSCIGRAAWKTIEEEFARGPSRVRPYLVGNFDLTMMAGASRPLRPEDVATIAEIRHWTAFLIKASYDENPIVRTHALNALSDRRQLLGKTVELKSVLPRIIECLDDPENPVRQCAARALFAFGEEGVNAATPSLLRLMKSQDSGTRKDAEDALNGVAPPPRRRR